MTLVQNLRLINNNSRSPIRNAHCIPKTPLSINRKKVINHLIGNPKGNL